MFARSSFKRVLVMNIRALRAAAVLLVVAPLVLAAQPAKKVYISVDMEGISGINGPDQTSSAGAEYGRARRLMVEDANAAVRGAFAGGATEVVVNDSHGSQRNLLPEDLDPRARLISHSFKRHGMMEGLDESFDAVVFVGYHAKAGSPRGVFAHTGSGRVADLTVNGVSVGEGGMNALLAQWYGVPVVVVTGDDVAIAEQRTTVPDVRGVVVKRAINSRAVELMPLAEARREIETAVRETVASARRGTPQRAPQYTVQLRYHDAAFVEIGTAFQEVRAVGPAAVEFTRATMPEAYRLIRVLYRFVTAD
jgi:D-amino peptidase